MKNRTCVFLLKRLALNKYIVFVIFFSISIVIYQYSIYKESNDLGESKDDSNLENISPFDEVKYHEKIVNSYFNRRREWRTSNLGSILFKNADVNVYRRKDTEKRTFTIVIWKYWNWLQHRHMYSFGASQKDISLEGCSVKNCVFPKNDRDFDTADAVVVHVQHGLFPNNTKKRNPRQRWIFLSDESPVNAFFQSERRIKLQDIVNTFNWSMTYRSESDVPVPYGRTIPLLESLEAMAEKPINDIIPNWSKKRQDVLAAILISHCGVSYRMNYVNELKKHLNLDVHGSCSENHKNSCPGHFRADCPIISEYLFYLVFENSKCQEYLTEKAFYHAYSKGAIPVIMGPTVQECETLLPPDSFLHVDNYDTVEELAMDIINISKDLPRLLLYHEWRRHFKVINEHGYFGSKSQHYCRICEALNYNDEGVKIYDENMLKPYFDVASTCT
ncbi:PREDICTED: alpha-(1,3)-fucosyltransferase 6-like isoform X2 [Papilio polytes]|uniref:alpha-(1,3)-fucosyltransferase 6-like isoform X2 n=1 Tax=Papilio polytes TaxID=76194 RepID=UPI000675E16C|nr:PREDICTED: alpha-(1,3)-fucosyltransferase 6-like isoform X2 [Papilio polytes]